MGKHDALTPKAIANKIKSKGLQKLRWYCQMCQKQCRDENGFKCHTMSESHQRQLLLFAEDPNKYLDTFSQEFKEGYLDILKRQYGGKRIHANQIYQEYIRWKEHIHMNSTKWLTLTEFIKWLGKEGICTVDETEKGWFVTYIDRDSEAILADEKKSKKHKVEMDDEERRNKFIQKQMERLKEKEMQSGRSEEGAPEAKVLKRENDDEKVVIALGRTISSQKSHSDSLAKNPLADLKKKDREKNRNVPSSTKKTALDEIMLEEARRKARDKKDYWLCPGIVVKVVTKNAGEKYYKQKGYVKEVIDKYAAIVVLLDGEICIKLDQVHCETVIPNIGRKVKVVNGPYRGQEATLVEINVGRFNATLKLGTGQVVHGIQYEDFSKFHSK